jgi:hypothetical protein
MEKRLRSLLSRRGVNIQGESLRPLKEACATVTESRAEYIELLAKPSYEHEPTEHELPDGQVVSITTEGCELR